MAGGLVSYTPCSRAVFTANAFYVAFMLEAVVRLVRLACFSRTNLPPRRRHYKNAHLLSAIDWLIQEREPRHSVCLVGTRAIVNIKAESALDKRLMPTSNF